MFKAISGFFASLGAIGVLAYIGLLIAGLIGYFINLWVLLHLFIADAPVQFTGLLLGRIIGVFFFPIGGILGYF